MLYKHQKLKLLPPFYLFISFCMKNECVNQ